MSGLSYQQLTAYAQQAGFDAAQVPVIVAIALAESGGDPLAHNTNTDGSIDRGVLQINSTQHAEVSNAVAYDPASAFQVAYTISQQGTNFNPWVTYTNGMYSQYLHGGSQPGSGNPLTNAAYTAGGVLGSMLSLFQSGQQAQTTVQQLSKVQDVVTNIQATPFWGWLIDPVRLAKLVTGGILLIVALALLFIPAALKLGDSVSQTAKKGGDVLKGVRHATI